MSDKFKKGDMVRLKEGCKNLYRDCENIRDQLTVLGKASKGRTLVPSPESYNCSHPSVHITDGMFTFLTEELELDIKKCECGSESIDCTTHSHWCPAREFKA